MRGGIMRGGYLREIRHWSNYIDFTSGGIFAAILGVNSPVIRKALQEAPMTCCYGAAYFNKTTERYKDMLREFTGYESVALFSTGSEATEAFWRVCRTYNGKPGVWGGLVDPDEIGGDAPLADQMHGWTLGALIMSGRMTWPELGYSPQLGRARFGMAPDVTSCMIMEPYHAPSGQFHRDNETTIGRIRGLQKEFPDIPLCVDEIQGGFGRTGKLFAHQWYNPALKPDFVTIGKGCGGGLPLSALLGPKEIMEDPRVIEQAHLHSTHSGNPVMCSVGIAVIEEIQREDLIRASYRKGVDLFELLRDCKVRHHVGRGLLAGLEFKGPEEVRKVVDLCYEKGLLVVDTGRKWIKLGPPLNIDERDLEQGCTVLKWAIGEVLNARQINS